MDQFLKWLAFLGVPALVFYAGMRFERWDDGRIRTRARRAWAALRGKATEDSEPPILFETTEEVTIPAGTKVEVAVRRLP